VVEVSWELPHRDHHANHHDQMDHLGRTARHCGGYHAQKAGLACCPLMVTRTVLIRTLPSTHIVLGAHTHTHHTRKNTKDTLVWL
jgi:hypothetical protein